MKPIKDFNGYHADELGNIHGIKNTILSKWIDNVGYYQTILYQDGKRKYRRVHRLIAETFIENPNNFKQVNHKDGDKLNNHISNLEWCDNSTNTQHGYDKGLYYTTSRKIEVKAYNKTTGKFIKEYESIRSMCEELCINRKTVTSILKGIKITNNYDYTFEYAS